MNSFAPWHSVGIAQTIKKLRTSSQGLLEREAAKRLEQVGPNIVFEKKSPPAFWRVVVSQWKNPLLLVVLLVAVIAAVVGSTMLSVTFAFLFFLHTIIGVVFEERQLSIQEFLRGIARSLSLVKRLQGPRKGAVSQLRPMTQVVPGDIVLLGTGDTVPADGRLLRSVDLQVDESMLTGESSPQEKQLKTLSPATSLLARTNMVFSQSMVTRGNAVVAVTATGRQTVVGSIGQEQQEVVKPVAPLVVDLKKLYRSIVLSAIILAVIVLVVGVARAHPLGQLVGLVVVIVVAIIPQWLLSTVALSFAEASRRLAGMGTMIKKSSSTDTLGRVSALCIDKTATLTQGALAVESVVLSNGEMMDATSMMLPKAPEDVKELWRAIVLCNDARASMLAGRGTSRLKFVGDNTDCAIAQSAAQHGLSREAVEKKNPRVRVFPFTTQTKWMATIHSDRARTTVWHLYAKGAPERVLEMCANSLIDGVARKLTSAQRSQIAHCIDRFATQGYRLLGVAKVTFPTRSRLPLTVNEVRDLTWVGLVLLSDPIRIESRLCLDELARMGLRILLVTGDHPITASTVARQLGLPASQIAMGTEIEAYSPEELAACVERTVVYARIEPRQKERIVSALQRNGHVVAMTGDGINDAFALKHSDIGIAVANATDIAREVADMVVTSENLFSMNAAIREGRRVFALIQTMLLFSLTTMSALAVVVLGGLFFASPIVIGPLHIVWLTMIIYLLPLLSLMSDRTTPVTSPRSSVWTRYQVVSSVGLGVFLGLIALLIALFRSQGSDMVLIRSTIWLSLSVVPLGLLIGGISGSWSRKNIRSHCIVSSTILLVIFLQMLTMTDPWLRTLFGVQGVSPWTAAAIVGGFVGVFAMRMVSHSSQHSVTV